MNTEYSYHNWDKAFGNDYTCLRCGVRKYYDPTEITTLPEPGRYKYFLVSGTEVRWLKDTLPCYGPGPVKETWKGI